MALKGAGAWLQPSAATALAAHRTGHDDAFARKMLGQRLLYRPAAGKAGDIDRGRDRHFGSELVLGCRHLQLFQLELHLVDQPDTTLRLRAIELPLEFFDAQLLPGNDGKIVGRLGLGNGKFSLDLGACRDELCPQGSNIVGKQIRAVFHARSESQKPGRFA